MSMNNFFYKLFDLYGGEDDKQKTLDAVKNNISFSGANIWILACAIIIASVGLNVNSTAVIIGAMLISPLMGPIVSAGFALGIYDFELLKRSLRNLLIATIVSLVVSTLYFFISPFKEAQSELLSRTSPNIYDILIAFFGGLVGVIAVTRVEKGNPIPGVAIATALMPPLCTAGYGLATGSFSYFFGAFFLYSINCVFICIATFIIVKYLKYPLAKHINETHEKRVKYGITALIVVMLVPSAYFAYNLYFQQKFTQSVNTFIEKEFTDNGNTVIYKNTNYKSNPKTIELAFLLKQFSDSEIKSYNEHLKNYGLTNTKLIFKQDSTDNITNLKNNIMNEIGKNELVFNEKDKQIHLLEAELSKYNYVNSDLLKEAQILFPKVNSLSISNHTYYFTTDSIATVPVLIYSSETNLNKEEKLKLTAWLEQKLALNNLEIFAK